MAKQPRFTLGAFAVIRDEAGRVLFCHRTDHDLWNLPGGGLESGEMPTQAVVREVREETGLEAEVERLVAVYSKTYRDDLVFLFTCRVVGGELRPNDEADAWAYFAVGEAPANTLASHLARAEAALRADSQPHFVLQTDEPQWRRQGPH